MLDTFSHDVTTFSITPIVKFKSARLEEEFYRRFIIIKTSDGDQIRLTLFAGARSILETPEEKAMNHAWNR